MTVAGGGGWARLPAAGREGRAGAAGPVAFEVWLSRARGAGRLSARGPLLSSLRDGRAGGAPRGQLARPLHQHPFPPSSEAAQQHTVTMSDRKAVIKNADMSEEMQQDSVECATQALEKYNIEKDIAAHIKKEFDKKYNPTWHCIVGRNFGSYVTHETKHFIYFYLGQVAILLFKSG
uniref:Dynein light chain n=1 Tax=Varanus komodoensis TaxID=61221 RepID=A0A8D2KYB9_VARKO